ncbi:MAG: glycosyltransferase family 9 protein [Gemmataceae bacterium]
MTPLHQLDAKRIALLKPSALGDIVHSLPVLHALRVRFPQAEITWVVNCAYAGLLTGQPDLTAALAFDRRRPLRAAVFLARELRRRRFDLVIDLQGLFRTGLMAAVSGAPRRVGLSSAREISRLAYTDVIDDSSELHAVERYWRVVEALGVGDLPREFHLTIADADRAWAEERLAVLPRPWLFVATGSRWRTKRWPPEHFATLAARCQQKYGGGTILIGAPDEAELSRGVAERLPGPTLDLTGRTSLPQLAAVLAQADAMLANDTGPLHLAAALGRPVVAPYTCTKISLHGPFGQSGAVATRVWCAGSYRRRCGRLECMAELTPDRLWPVLDEVLFSWASPCRSA